LNLARRAVLFLAILMAGLSVWQLERVRTGIDIAPLQVGTTPATVYRLPDAGPAPVVVIAHGFAGSRQLMEGFALMLARAGYTAVSYDLQGHGRNPVPMSGDATKVGGTTQLLMDELGRVSDAALALSGADGRLALLGHSMASDIVVRQAVRDRRVGAVVAVSMFSTAVTAAEPRDLLVIAGSWETMLAAEAEKALRLADPAASIGQTVGDPAEGTGRRAVLAPGVEHIGVLYSATALREARDWLNLAFGRTGDGPVPQRGGWIALLLVSVVALGWPLAGLLRRFRADRPPPQLSRRRFLVALLVPALATPLLLAPFDLRFLPVLVADYLAVHLGVYGAIILCVAGAMGGLRQGGAGVALLLAVPVALFGIVLFGGVLDRYVASFLPVGGRIPVVLAMAAGAVPFLLADAALTEGGRAPLWRVLAVRAVALGSLGLAVALNFERLFFLLIILPVILVFFLLFGTVGGWVGRAIWRPAAAGTGLGLFLGWALAVTFPMFAA
jgi:dienelactone hydrolase